MKRGTIMASLRGWLWRRIGRGSTFYAMHGRLMREVGRQQRANRRKRRQLAGLRFERSRLRAELARLTGRRWLDQPRQAD